MVKENEQTGYFYRNGKTVKAYYIYRKNEKESSKLGRNYFQISMFI